MPVENSSGPGRLRLWSTSCNNVATSCWFVILGGARAPHHPSPDPPLEEARVPWCGFGVPAGGWSEAYFDVVIFPLPRGCFNR